MARLCDLSHIGCTEAAQRSATTAIGEAIISPGYFSGVKSAQDCTGNRGSNAACRSSRGLQVKSAWRRRSQSCASSSARSTCRRRTVRRRPRQRPAGWAGRSLRPSRRWFPRPIPTRWRPASRSCAPAAARPTLQSPCSSCSIWWSRNRRGSAAAPSSCIGTPSAGSSRATTAARRRRWRPSPTDFWSRASRAASRTPSTAA